jgi:hypothetical protein
MLATMHESDGAGLRLPPDSQVRAFQSAIHAVCSGGGYGNSDMTNVAATIYVMADDLKP